MTQSSDSRVPLTIRAGDALTSISVRDGRFREIASATGRLSTRVSPGLYKVRLSAASSVDDHFLEVSPGDAEAGINVNYGPVQINTSAPLSGSRLATERTTELLAEISRLEPEIDRYSAAQLLVYLRDPGSEDFGRAAASVTIRESDGETTATMAESGRTETDEAGFSLNVDPGIYRIRVETGPRGDYEIFVPTARGWQTRVFLACDDFYSGEQIFRRPSLRSASVLMARIGEPFDASNRDARLAEIALGALVQNRQILDSEDMRELLHGKFEDPMLGILAGHMLLDEPDLRKELLQTVCHNLLNLIGPVPDLQALETRLEKRVTDGHSDLGLYIGRPPMLVRSWDLLVMQSRRRFSVIPAGSLSDQISGSVVAIRPWLMSRCASAARPQDIEQNITSVAEARRIMARLARQLNADQLSTIQQELSRGKETLEPIENALLDVLAKTPPSEAIDSPVARGTSSLDLGIDVPTDVKLESSVGLRKIQAPSYSIARSTVSLANKLASRLNLPSQD